MAVCKVRAYIYKAHRVYNRLQMCFSNSWYRNNKSDMSQQCFMGWLSEVYPMDKHKLWGVMRQWGEYTRLIMYTELAFKAER